MDEHKLLERITVNPQIFGGKPIVRGRRLAVEHVLAMLAAGDSVDAIVSGYPWLEREDVQACLVYARRVTANERIEPLTIAVRAAPSIHAMILDGESGGPYHAWQRLRLEGPSGHVPAVDEE